MSDTTMDFINKIKYQQSSLLSDIYVTYIMAKLRKETTPSIVLSDKVCFDSNLPVDFAKFLYDCNSMLSECPRKGLDFHELDVKYLATLIYSALYEEESEQESESVPTQGLVLFLTLNSDKFVDVFKLDKIVFETLFDRIMEVYKYRIVSHKISVKLMEQWSQFLVTNINYINKDKLIDIFILNLLYDGGDDVLENNEFNCQIELAKAIFDCLGKMIELHDFADQKKITTVITLKLIKAGNNSDNNKLVLPCILLFFKDILEQFCDERWYFAFLITILKELKDKEIFIHIINQLPVERHENITNIMINNYIQATDENDIILYLDIMNLMIKFPYQNIPDERRRKLVKRILTETFFRGTHKSYTIREHVMVSFITWSPMKDISVRHCLQIMFHRGNKIRFSLLFEVIHQLVDLSWKQPAYNIAFIIFTCRLFILNRNFITQRRMRILEILCYKSTAYCLKPCVPVIMELIRHFALTPHPILKPILTLVLNHALSATTSSNYYLKELFNLLSNSMVATNDSEVEFALCNTILSDDFNCMELFKVIRIHNFVRAEHIEVLLEEKILKHTCSWKLLTVLLENIDYTSFPPYMEHYFQRIKLASFFGSPEAVYVLQVLTKIFNAKIKNGVIDQADQKLAIMIDSSVTNHFRDMTIPPKQVADAIILMLTLNKISHFSMNWVNHFFSQILAVILAKITESTEELARFPIARHIIYLEQMLLLLDMNIEPKNIRKLLLALKVERQASIHHEQVYAGIVGFLGKICLKYTNWLKPAAPLIKHAMTNGPSPVQLMSMSILYDMSNLRLHEFDHLYSGLLKLITNDKIEVRNMAVKMVVKLVNDSHIRLKCKDFISLMLVLLDRNYRLCLYFIELLENDFIHRNEHTVEKYFINLIFFLNGYKDNEQYPLPADIPMGDQDVTYERRIIIYKFLYCNLERTSQLKLLDLLNTEFLLPFYNGRVNVAANTLNIVRDVLTLTCFHASEYMDELNIDDIEVFYDALFVDMKRDFFSRKRFAEPSTMDFDQMLEKLLVSLLKLLYKTEKANLSMLPQFFSTVGVVTRAFYNKVVQTVHDNSGLRNLYYELENCFNKYKQMMRGEPLDVLSYCDKQEWRLYLG